MINQIESLYGVIMALVIIGGIGLLFGKRKINGLPLRRPYGPGGCWWGDNKFQHTSHRFKMIPFIVRNLV